MNRNILYTGFKGERNSSFVTVKLLSGDKVFLTNSFGGIRKDISKIQSEYHKIIMFGLDKTLKNEIRFETVAERDGEYMYSKADISYYVKKTEQLNISYIISNRPTHYLCNYAYFEMMKKSTVPVLFVHIPSMKNMSEIFAKKLPDIFNEKIQNNR